MKFFRFRLSALLIFVTAVAVFFGYSQWRRQRILTLCYKLSCSHVEVVRPDSWIDKLWQRKPYGAVYSSFDALPGFWQYNGPFLQELGIEEKLVSASDSKRELANQEVRNGRAWLPDDEYWKPLKKQSD